jgi:Tol biopolymer transport system component
MRMRIVTIGLLLLFSSAALHAVQNWNTLFEQALQKERADRDIPGAIEILKRIVSGAADRPLVARSLVQLGGCYEALGDKNTARDYYQQVAGKYADLADLANVARARLADLGPALSSASFTLRASTNFWDYQRKPMAISPDGSTIVYAADNVLHLLPTRWMANPDVYPIMSIPGTQYMDASGPVFSPDGKSVAFHSLTLRAIKRIDITGGAAVDVYRFDRALPFNGFVGMSWGPGDEIVFGQGRGGIVRVPANGGKAQTIVAMTNGESAAYPQILPGGDAVLFTLTSPARGYEWDWDKAAIAVQSLKTGDRKILAQGADARYISTGHVLFARGTELLAIPFDLKRLEATGPEVSLEGQLDRRGFYNYGQAHYSVSENGTLVYAPGTAWAPSTYRPQLVDRATGNTATLELRPAWYETLRYSPNGRQLAYSIWDAKDSNIYVQDLSGSGEPRQLTGGGWNTDPVWSADGALIYFSSNREGDQAIFSMRADGIGTPERVTRPDDGSAHLPTSLRNGILLFNKYKGLDSDIWAYSFKEGKAMPAVESPGYEANGVLSPDGRWIAYTTDTPENGRFVQVWAVPFPNRSGAKPVQISPPGYGYPVWSPDGKEIYYVSYDGNGYRAVTVLQTAPALTVSETAPALARLVIAPGEGWNTWSSRLNDVRPDGQQYIRTVQVTGFAVPRQFRAVFNWFDQLKQRVKAR